MLSLAHLLQTPVFSYSQQHGQWQRYSPHDVDRQLMDDIHQRSGSVRAHLRGICIEMSWPVFLPPPSIYPHGASAVLCIYWYSRILICRWGNT
ncbi:hypothetical protein GBAR_LOCUS16825 [Geodia barretti]|uniref:Uncharacterized protein n=1 Tax=Geodia barretti TaxID=519541 RepID=A0AA35WWY0_GEOBA|nr:hypothetical protein GBAR_LOCUS16825 [Geodia barretti]